MKGSLNKDLEVVKENGYRIIVQLILFSMKVNIKMVKKMDMVFVKNRVL